MSVKSNFSIFKSNDILLILLKILFKYNEMISSFPVLFKKIISSIFFSKI